MNKLYIFYSLLIIGLFCGSSVDAQRIFEIPPSDDPTMPTDIQPIIMGDTSETGERTDMNTIYTLQNGAVYVVSDQIANQGWPLQIQAADLDNIATKPVISRIPNASGDWPNMLRAFGDLTLLNLWVIAGERGPGEQMDWGKNRIMGDSLTVVIDNCIFEKDRGGFVQLRGERAKVYITNSVFRNAANRFILEGNGRVVDARTTAIDTLVVRNCVMHNIVDRIFRSQGGAEPHNYIEFDQNTIFNHGGRHGTFQFGKVLSAKITNNVMENPNMSGTSPQYTDEQTQPDNEAHHVFTVDTLFDATNFTFANNNIYYTQDVLDFYAGNDTVTQVEVYSQLILDVLGDDAPNTYFSEVLELESVPSRETFLQYYRDLYANPMSDNMQDIVAEDIALAGTAFDFGNLFDYATFSPCYSDMSMSATAGEGGGAIGATGFCEGLTTSINLSSINVDLQVMPNPVVGEALISFELDNNSLVNLALYDIMGRQIETILNGEQPQGSQQIRLLRTYDLPSGTYILKLQTPEGQASTKVMIQK